MSHLLKRRVLLSTLHYLSTNHVTLGLVAGFNELYRLSVCFVNHLKINNNQNYRELDDDLKLFQLHEWVLKYLMTLLNKSKPLRMNSLRWLI